MTGEEMLGATGFGGKELLAPAARTGGTDGRLASGDAEAGVDRHGDAVHHGGAVR